jgi:hypothetical protein
MSLKQILEKFVQDHASVAFWDGRRTWKAEELLDSLPMTRLVARAHLQPGHFIAEISETGYLGPVMLTLKPQS